MTFAGDPGKAPSKSVGVSSKSAMSLRMILDSSMLTVKNACEETGRGLSDLAKALAAGSGEELHRQFVDCFPELVAAIFGLPLQQQQQQQQQQQMQQQMQQQQAPYSSGWFGQANSVEEYELLYQLLHGKGHLFSVILQLSSVQHAAHYSFPIAALPSEAIQLLQSFGIPNGAGGVGVGGGGGIGGGGGLPSGNALGSSPLSSFLYARFNRHNISGLSLNMLEYFLCAFAWFATSQKLGVKALLSSSGSSSYSASSSALSSSASSPFSRSMQDTLFSSLMRQYSMILLELEARSEALSGASYMRGPFMRGGGVEASSKFDLVFHNFVNIAAMFWLYQNPTQLFFAASAAVQSASKANLYVFRARYVAPTLCSLLGLYDLMLLLVHSVGDAPPAPTTTPFASQFQFQHHQPAASYQQHGSAAVAIAAGRVCSLVLREIVFDPLYRMFKLALLFAPNSWPHLATLWHVVVSPWSYGPRPDAQASLISANERFVAFQQEKERRSAYNTSGAPVAGQSQLPVEDFPFSTQILCPYLPESLKSPFVVPVTPGQGRSSVSSSTKNAISGMSSLFNLSSIFGGNFGTPSSSSIGGGGSTSNNDKSNTTSSSSSSNNSSSSSSRNGNGGSSATGSGMLISVSVSSSSSKEALLRPQNWSWYTFCDPLVSLATTTSNTEAAASTEFMHQDVRATVVANFAFYLPLLRTWTESLHGYHVEQTQPLSLEVLIGVERIWSVLSSPQVLPVLRELDVALHQPLDRFSDGKLELDKRLVLERWMALEHSAYSAGLFFSDHHLSSLASDWLKEMFLFGRLSSDGQSSTFKQISDGLARCSDLLFGVSRSEIDVRVASAALEMSSSSQGAAQSAASSKTSSSAQRLSAEQRAMLRDGRLYMERGNAVFVGDVWDRPVTSSESWVALWLLFRFSLLCGLAERRTNATKTYFNLRPLGSKLLLWSLVVLILAVFVISRLGRISLGGLFELEEEE